MRNTSAFKTIFFHSLKVFVFFASSFLLADYYHCGQTFDPPPNNSGSSSTPPGNSQNNAPKGADPILLNSGAFYHRETDMVIPGIIPIVFSRGYHNQSDYNGPVGHNWDFSFNKRLEIHTNGDVTLYEPSDGPVTIKLEYIKSGSAYTAPDGCFRTLTKTGSYYYQKDTHGNEWKFDSNGLLVLVSDRNGNSLTLEYDSGDRVSMVYDDFGRSIELAYDDNGRIVSITDAGNRQVTYTYSGSNLIKVTKSGNRTTQYGYDANHNLTSIKNSRQQVWLHNSYDSENRVTSQIYNGATATIVYDTTNHKTTLTDWRGYVTDYYFDATIGNQTQITVHSSNLRPSDPATYTTSFTYNNNLQKTRVTMPDGSWVKYSYDSSGNLLELRRKKINAPDTPQADDLVTTLIYDSTFNFPLTVTDPKGNVTSLGYDSNGNVTSVTAPLIGATTYTCDSLGRTALMTAPNGVIGKYEYFTSSGYLQRFTNDYGTGKLNAAVEYIYNDTGQITAVTDPEGNISTTSYNSYELPFTITRSSALNVQTKVYYDADGNITQINNKKDSSGTNWDITQFSYDQRSHVTQTVHGTATTNYEYDPAGNLKKVTDAEGKITNIVYDERGLLWKQTDANSGVTEYSYTPNGQLAKLKDANGNETSYIYDDFGRVTRATYPNASYEELTYDKNSNVLTRRTRKGDVITFVYDALNRMTSKTAPDTGVATYAYDNSSRMTSAVNSNGTLSFTYDNLNRPAQTTDTHSRVLGHEYDLNGNRTKLIYPDSSYITAEFDAVDRLTAIKDQISANIASFTHNPLSQTTRIDYANGTHTDYAFNNLEDLQSINHQLGATDRDYSYTRDKLGNALTMTAPNAALHTYTYDNIYQVTQVDYPGGGGSDIVAYTFDPLGNRQTVNDDGTVTNYTANSLNQYTLIDAVVPTYDNNGNTTSDGTDTYEYDSENRLTKVTTAANIIEYDYDALDRRIEKRVYDSSHVLQNTERYLNDSADVLCEYDATNTETVRYVLAGLDRPVRRTNNGTTHYYYHADNLGSITEISDATGTLVESCKYDIYGNVRIFNTAGTEIPESSIGNDYFFTGRRYSKETKLYYYRARFYSAKLGRFLQPDPIGYFGGINIYAYCGNNSVNYIDPWGEDWLDASANYAAGFGDSITFGSTGYIRSWGGFDAVNRGSGAYTAGQWSGVAWSLAWGGAGAAKAAGGARNIPWYELGQKWLPRLTKRAGRLARWNTHDSVTKGKMIWKAARGNRFKALAPDNIWKPFMPRAIGTGPTPFSKGFVYAAAQAIWNYFSREGC